MEEVKIFWENCGPDYAHLLDSAKHSKHELQKQYRNLILNFIPSSLTGKRVIDYGCGGGFLGELLFTRFNIAHYIGIDIAKRSIQAVKERLRGKACSYYLLPVVFKQLKADAFFSFACIQHFPSKIFLDQFLLNLNESNIKTIGLHFREGSKNEFANNYKTKGNIGLCCRTTAHYIESKLPLYSTTYLSEVAEHSGAQAIILVLK